MYTVLIVLCCDMRWAFFGLRCAKLAIQRNKNDITATFVGILFGVFGLLYYGLSLNEEENKDEE